MSGKKRQCVTCRYFQDAGMAGSGWCTHPKRQLSSDVRILVRPAELACRNAWGVDLWADKDGVEPDAPTAADAPGAIAPPDAPTQEPAARAPRTSFDDEITSVVSSEIHRSRVDQDLNDRLVEQTTIRLDDDTNTEDDRFHLLSRGGRDSVGQARQRHLRRRQDHAPRRANDEEPHDDEDASPTTEVPAASSFTPDDYVEQEDPSHFVASEQPDETPQNDDDIVLDHDSSLGSPRSRRLRRSREQTQGPKSGIDIEMDADIDAPLGEMAGEMPALETERAVPAPELTSDVDLSAFRRRSTPPDFNHRETDTAEHMPAPPSREGALDRAAKRAESIKAAARSERKERLGQERRQTRAPLGTDEPAQDSGARLDRGTSRHVAGRNDLFPEDRNVLSARYSAEPPTHGATGARRVANGDQAEIRDTTDVDAAHGDHVTPRPHRHEARRSWWRGFFHRSMQQQTPDEFLDDWTEDAEEPHTASSQDDWDTDENEHHDRYGESIADSEEFYADEPDGQQSEWIAAVYEADNDPTDDRTATEFAALDLQDERDMNAFRERLFTPTAERATSDGASATQAPAGRTPITLSRRPEARPADEASMWQPEPRSATPVPDTGSSLPGERWSAPETAPRNRATDHGDKPVSTRPSAATMPRQGQAQREQRAARRDSDAVYPDDLLQAPADAWFEPEIAPEFDIRAIIEQRTELLDMTIQISPDVPRECATCRSYRMSEQGERGWCTNNWAFTHRQMVNATDLACQSTVGCWWLPADEEVWLTGDEQEHGATPRVDRLIAHLDPLKSAVGR